MPITGDRIIVPRIMPKLYAMGAKAGIRKRWWEWMMAVIKLETAKKSWAVSITRSKEAMTETWCGLKPGAIRREKNGAKVKITRDNTINTSSMRFNEALAIYQAWDSSRER